MKPNIHALNAKRNAAIYRDHMAGDSFTTLEAKYQLSRGRLFQIVRKEEERQETRRAYVQTRKYPAYMDDHARLMLDALRAIEGERRLRLMLVREWGYNGNLFQPAELTKFIARMAIAGPDAIPVITETEAPLPPPPPEEESEDII